MNEVGKQSQPVPLAVYQSLEIERNRLDEQVKAMGAEMAQLKAVLAEHRRVLAICRGVFDSDLLCPECNGREDHMPDCTARVIDRMLGAG